MCDEKGAHVMFCQDGPDSSNEVEAGAALAAGVATATMARGGVMGMRRVTAVTTVTWMMATAPTLMEGVSAEVVATRTTGPAATALQGQLAWLWCP